MADKRVRKIRKRHECVRYTAKEYREMFKSMRDSIIPKGVRAVQMTAHNPQYFITDEARIYSVSPNKIIELEQ